jgi:hypothetical protein
LGPTWILLGPYLELTLEPTFGKLTLEQPIYLCWATSIILCSNDKMKREFFLKKKRSKRVIFDSKAESLNVVWLEKDAFLKNRESLDKFSKSFFDFVIES